mmetsp:Transcript_7638/g.19983  ORF Transcript_7638/g.19983 Transcript_7638/m.19983 type:complete len:230 (+) Transcript_7638:2238-2927(+)
MTCCSFVANSSSLRRRLWTASRVFASGEPQIPGVAFAKTNMRSCSAPWSKSCCCLTLSCSAASSSRLMSSDCLIPESTASMSSVAFPISCSVSDRYVATRSLGSVKTVVGIALTFPPVLLAHLNVEFARATIPPTSPTTSSKLSGTEKSGHEKSERLCCKRRLSALVHISVNVPTPPRSFSANCNSRWRARSELVTNGDVGGEEAIDGGGVGHKGSGGGGVVDGGCKGG